MNTSLCSANMGHLYHFPLPKAQRPLWTMVYKSQRLGKTEEKLSSGQEKTTVFMDSQLWMPAQGRHQVEPINSPAWRSSLTEELLIVDEDSSNFLGRKTQFSLRVWLLIGLPHCRGWPHTCEHKGRTDWTG